MYRITYGTGSGSVDFETGALDSRHKDDEDMCSQHKDDEEDMCSQHKDDEDMCSQHKDDEEDMCSQHALQQRRLCRINTEAHLRLRRILRKYRRNELVKS